MKESAPESAATSSTKWFGRTLALSALFGVAATAMFFLAGRDLAGRPTTVGTVVRSDSSWYVNTPSNGKGWLQANIVYAYKVGGRDYRGINYDQYGPYGSWLPYNEERVAGLLKEYPVGREATVYYALDDPSDAILTPYRPWWQWALLFIGGTILALVVLANVRYYRGRLAKRRAADASQHGP
jgi:hypothetical protein